jgi:alkanesulfonate monooxygenase SsuD/methylene tetrahydromethanopterin reductase-like flavin-dependent oxidoreductase (luciferase family)
MLSYRAGFSAHGHLDKQYAILALSVFCADTEEAAQRMASSMLLSFARLRTGRPGRLPSPGDAMKHVFTADEQAVVDFFKRIQIVGTPETVRTRIEAIAKRTAADEVMIATHAYDLDSRIRSYELIAQAFELDECSMASVSEGRQR